MVRKGKVIGDPRKNLENVRKDLVRSQNQKVLVIVRTEAALASVRIAVKGKIVVSEGKFLLAADKITGAEESFVTVEIDHPGHLVTAIMMTVELRPLHQEGLDLDLETLKVRDSTVIVTEHQEDVDEASEEVYVAEEGAQEEDSENGNLIGIAALTKRKFCYCYGVLILAGLVGFFFFFLAQCVALLNCFNSPQPL